ncbi:MAG: hypothetical protein PUC05_02505 [Firmicutes bacterium]|nr:hypothetical protein [Bacillota bacterium]
MKIAIDTNYDFTSDTPHYWDNYWDNDIVLGGFNNDPDCSSKTLQKYHQALYSKQLPNGNIMSLVIGSGANYLTWNGFRFGSDSIIASFRYKNYRHLIEQASNSIDDWKSFVETYLRKSYTLGGEIIFPKRPGGINQTRGCSPYIKDRFDLTLECIRRFYSGEKSPLYDTLVKDKDFFDLFLSFEGYIDYFYLQDCVSPDYSAVLFWLGNGEFDKNPLPKTVNDYFNFMAKELEFVKKRNNRIQAAYKMSPL